MKKLLFLMLSVGWLCASAEKIAPVFEGGEVVDIWADAKMPDNVCREPETLTGEFGKRWMQNVSKPRLEFFRAKGTAKTGLVIICPGGGYNGLSADYEGGEVAKWLTERGVSAAVLWYRVPDNMKGALNDLRRAVRVARANAEKWNIDPDKICVMGFSAGANLSARASTRAEGHKFEYKRTDAIDKFSAKPTHTCLIYPAYCDNPGFRDMRVGAPRFESENPDYDELYKIAQNLPINKDTPPAFIVQTLQDRTYVNSSIAYFLALKKAGVPADLFLCDKGPHGYGLGFKNPQDLVSMWPDLFDKWLTINKFKDK